MSSFEETVSGGDDRAPAEPASASGAARIEITGAGSPPEAPTAEAEFANAMNDRLLLITAAIAEAVTAEQVYEAIVDRVGAALGATSVGLWLVREPAQTAWLCRSYGYNEAARRQIEVLFLDREPILPVVDAFRRREPIWIPSQEDLVRRYPNLASMVTQGLRYRVASLPIIVQPQRVVVGLLAFTFDPALTSDDEDRRFMLLVTRYAGQALERLTLLESEQQSRRRAEEAAARTTLLYSLARSVIAADSIDQVFDTALEVLQAALHTDRASILVQDDAGAMRFRAWRGLSDDYRRAVEGRSPWARDARDPQPVVVENTETDAALAAVLPVLRAERIGALALVPLVAHGRLLGKLTVYFPRPRALAPRELDLVRAIADHVAAALARFTATAELQATVRFNEMFTGILGHDLRNPLAAIVMAGRLAVMQARTADLALLSPLNRILKSGDRMGRMIDQLLDFTRLRTGGIPLSPRATDLGPLLVQVIDELENGHPGRNVHRQQRGDTRGTFDDDRLAQVFSNLVANALQHGAPEQPVTVVLDGAARDSVTLEVHNRGAIPPAQVSTLFEPMTGKARRHDRARGLGLGLFITREIVRAHGGIIEVTSDEQTGTRFVVRLPRGTESAGETRADRPLSVDV